MISLATDGSEAVLLEDLEMRDVSGMIRVPSIREATLRDLTAALHDRGMLTPEAAAEEWIAAIEAEAVADYRASLAARLAEEWCERSKSGLLCERHDRALFPTLSPRCNGWAEQIVRLIESRAALTSEATNG